jgi:hypothetical protein
MLTTITVGILIGTNRHVSNTAYNGLGASATVELFDKWGLDNCRPSHVRFAYQRGTNRKVFEFDLDDVHPEPEILKLYAPERSGAFHLIIVGGYGTATPILVTRISSDGKVKTVLDIATKGKVTLSSRYGRLAIKESWDETYFFGNHGIKPTSKEARLKTIVCRYVFNRKSGTYDAEWTRD